MTHCSGLFLLLVFKTEQCVRMPQCTKRSVRKMDSVKKMNNRKVWGICWKLKNGTWNSEINLSWRGASFMFVLLWEAGVREMRLKRLGVGFGN